MASPDLPSANGRTPPGISRLFQNMNIGSKLTLGFGIIVLLTLLVVGWSYLSSSSASDNIETTNELRVPIVLASSQAQANLLTMLGDVRGYLALGDEESRDGYEAAQEAFEADLAELEQLISANQHDPSIAHLNTQFEELQTAYAAWLLLPERLFALRDDQLRREPALRMLIQDATPLISSTLSTTDTLIKSKSQQEPTAQNTAALADLAKFQQSFTAMVSGLRGYVTTGRNSFKFEYQSNLDINEEVWGNITSRTDRFNLTQLEYIRTISLSRQAFLDLPPEMFDLVEGEHAREDLYLFRTEAVPLTEQMSALLSEITLDQQNLLQSDLNEGSDQLAASQLRNLGIGLVAVLVAIALAYTIQRSIVGPLERLTLVANEIGAGKLTARASMESNDEIGVLATRFNAMTGRLSDALDDLEMRRQEQTEIAEKFRQQNEYLSALHQTALGMMSRLNLDELLEALMARVGQLLNTSHGFIYLTESELSDRLELKIGTGIFHDQVGIVVQAGEGLGGRVWQAAQPILVKDYDSWEGRVQDFGYKLIGTTVAVPLSRPTSQFAPYAAPIGVIGIAYDPNVERNFGDDEMELLSRFSELASLAIDNARLYAVAQEARAAAEAADQSKTDFLSSVSHELRTPLTSVLGFARIIQKEFDTKILPIVPLDDRKIKRAVDGVTEDLSIIISEGERLTTLINNVLDLAKIEAGKIEWHLEPVSIASIVERAAAATSALFDQKQLAFVKDVPAELPPIIADEDKLIQVVINLLSNAIKFTDTGSITTRARIVQNEVVISVIDTGLGIAPEDQPKVFEKFKQVGDTLTDKPKGTGLGLPICKEIVEHHGGRIWVESEPGQGSTFAFALSMNTTSPSEMIPAPMDIHTLIEGLQFQIMPANEGTRTILVVDDEEPIRKLLRKELEEAGYLVREAANGTDAIVQIQESRPDLVILDILMPGISGFDVVAALKHNPETMGMPIIILSIVENKERGYSLGVECYLNKPIDSEVLRDEIGKLLSQSIGQKIVLVIDENAETVKTLSDILSANGYQVIETFDRETFIQQAVMNKPDMIIGNIALLEQQNLLRTLRVEEGLRHTSIMVYENRN